MFDKIPDTRPLTPILDLVDSPQVLRGLDENELEDLAAQLRAFLLYSVGQTGGHLGAGLGVVELTIALHRVMQTPEDDLIWDVGHQAYPHKALTGRREALLSIRSRGGIAPFPDRSESAYDAFGVGHASTSISAALGMSLAKRQKGDTSLTVAVVGDGAMTAGMAYEALNHAAHTHANMLIVLNDNSMSISENVGGMSNYLSNLASHRRMRLKTEPPLVTPATIFEDLGLKYFGPENGHNLHTLISRLRHITQLPGPKLLHIKTEKGRGYKPAVHDPIGYHALSKIETENKNNDLPQGTKYQKVFGDWICKKARQDPTLIGITPAMREGSGLVNFAEQFPERFFDVAIAEQHALTFAAGLACKSLKPVVAIYSTFLQRAYDQLIHDIALQNLDVTLAVDRAGLVGGDGATHHGTFDIAFLRCIPNLIIAAPSDVNECIELLDTAYHHPGPALVRYPRGFGPEAEPRPSTALGIGKSKMIRSGKKICFLNFGALLHRLTKLAEELDAGLCDMRWLKPIDSERISALAERYDTFVVLEDGCRDGGAGSAVLEYLSHAGLEVRTLLLGIPDQFIGHGTRDETLDISGLSPETIRDKVMLFIK